MKRRDFIKISAGLTGIVPLMQACKQERVIPGHIVGASSKTGHLLRDHAFAEPATSESRQIVIVGGGVSGLSAARQLYKDGFTDVTLLDLEDHMGGNASSGSNQVSKYPWGAHYIPIPNNNLTEYLSFLQEAEVITGHDAQGLPVYNEFHLCQDPEERLYINGKWQDGLVPRFGLTDPDWLQFKNFFMFMEIYRNRKGKDGKDAFAIPVDDSSKDENFLALDRITMKAWMDEKELDCTYIRWYVDYCTRDDFGTTYDRISAWTGIHYFASRKGKGSNAAYNDVLTWEQGNGFLIEQLLKQGRATIKSQALAVAVKQVAQGVQVNYFDVKEQKLKGLIAAQCILAVPQFVAARLLKDDARLDKVHQHLHYAPWMVANLTVAETEERNGAPPSWDNVIYGSKSLGYVDATHQQLQQRKSSRNLTYYLPLTHSDPETARKAAYAVTHAAWTKQILDDLKIIHPDIEDVVERIDIMLWGHAMAQPLPGIVHGPLRSGLGQSIGDRIHFAHTDLAGISIFEEGFYQGIHAAKKIKALINTGI
jgi:hypothetical protein